MKIENERILFVLTIQNVTIWFLKCVNDLYCLNRKTRMKQRKEKIRKLELFQDWKITVHLTHPIICGNRVCVNEEVLFGM